jgi:hypothetical protein
MLEMFDKLILVQFEVTLKAFANFSPRLRSGYPG